MKPTFKDYLSIALALLAIFLCGYGIGFLFGERKGLQNAPPPPSAETPAARSVTVTDWEQATLEALQRSIELTPAQREVARAEIAAIATRIEGARHSAREVYRHEMEGLHERLRPHLTPTQWEKLQKPPTGPNESK